MIDYLNSPNRCFVKNCHKEQLEAIDKNKKISDNMNSIIQKLIKNEITQEQANVKLNKLKESSKVSQTSQHRSSQSESEA